MTLLLNCALQANMTLSNWSWTVSELICPILPVKIPLLIWLVNTRVLLTLIFMSFNVYFVLHCNCVSPASVPAAPNKQFDVWHCRLVFGLLSSMSAAELMELEQTELYPRCPVLQSARQRLSSNSPTEKSIVMELHKIPERHIGKLIERLPSQTCGMLFCTFCTVAVA